MDKRAVFNRVKDHLLAQRKQSMAARADGSNICAYRGENSLMCAIGCLIADEHYSPLLEAQSVACGQVWTALKHSGIPMHVDGISDMLNELQTIHDFGIPNDWPSQLLAMELEWFGTDLAGA